MNNKERFTRWGKPHYTRTAVKFDRYQFRERCAWTWVLSYKLNQRTLALLSKDVDSLFKNLKIGVEL